MERLVWLRNHGNGKPSISSQPLKKKTRTILQYNKITIKIKRSESTTAPAKACRGVVICRCRPRKETPTIHDTNTSVTAKTNSRYSKGLHERPINAAVAPTGTVTYCCTATRNICRPLPPQARKKEQSKEQSKEQRKEGANTVATARLHRLGCVS